MKLNSPQRGLLLLGMVLAVSLLPLVGGFHHHHDGEARGTCWFCTTASSAVESLSVQLNVVSLVFLPVSRLDFSPPFLSIWSTPQRRGPPAFSRA